jgi:hypothetical protein
MIKDLPGVWVSQFGPRSRCFFWGNLEFLVWRSRLGELGVLGVLGEESELPKRGTTTKQDYWLALQVPSLCSFAAPPVDRLSPSGRQEGVLCKWAKSRARLLYEMRCFLAVLACFFHHAPADYPDLVPSRRTPASSVNTN